MRQIAGVWRRDAALELTSNLCWDTRSEAGVFCAVLHHTNASAHAPAFIEQYRRLGAATVHERTHDCAVVLFDENARKLFLARDRLGMSPFYFGANSYGFAFGTRVMDVINALRYDVAPNRRALAAILVDHGAAPRGETYFQGIAVVPPGTTLIRHGNQNAILPAADFWKGARAPHLRYQDTVAEFGERFRAAVAARVDAQRPTAVFVSGGLDSAAIFCAAAQTGQVIGINYGVRAERADEFRYVTALRSAGLRVDDVAFYPITSSGAIEQAARDCEVPVLDQVPLTLQRAASAARATGAQTVLLGTWGDQVLAPFPPPHVAALAPWRLRTHRSLAHAFRQYMSDVKVRDIQRAFVRQALGRRAPNAIRKRRRSMRRRRSMFDSLARDFPAADTPRAPRSYAEALRHNVFAPEQTEAIAGTTQWGLVNHVDVRLPFLDVDLLRFLHTVPDVYAYHGNRLKPLLRDALVGVVPAPILNRRDKGDYTAAIHSGGPRVAASLDQLDGLRRLVSHDLMSAESAAKTLARLRRQSDIAAASDELMRLLGLDAWLRVFF